MPRRWFENLAAGILPIVVACVLTGHSRAQAQDLQSEQGAPAVFDGQALFTVCGKTGQYTAEERALVIGKRLVSLAESGRILPDAIRAIDRGTVSGIVAEDQLLLAITEEDVTLTGRTRQELATDYAHRIRRALADYREKWSLKRRLLGGLYALLTTVLLVLVISVLRHSRRKLCARIEHLGEPSVPLRKIQRQEVIVSTQYKSFLVTLAGIGYWALLLTLVGVFIAVVMSFFPRTVSYATSLSDWLLSPLKDFGGGIAAYLPNLFFVAVICFVTYFVLKLSTFIFTAIQDGKISIEGFYPDWAGPTSHLVRILVYLLVVIITYPYLPGSKSPVFQGISVFLGFLLSLGSSSVVANTVAGTILTYMRPFRQGDRVTIGETQGVIVEKSLLVTRVRTPKNVVVTIPNGSVMGSQIINFSTLAQEEGLILHTTVTIGYDAPWRKVHELLINAALTTEHILKEPAPFVLQTSLDDFYITYEINAYTDDTRIEIMEITYSTLHQNIQDAFNAAGVEIMSPHYTSLRDGNETTIPGHRGGSNETSQMIQLFPNKRVKP